MEFLSGWWALGALLAVPIILLYLLKMRRRPLEVSSTLLWEQVLADLRANTPFQKLRRNLLLLLQLLTLAVLVLALMQPVIRATGLSGSAAVIVLDASPSMQAVDEPGGADRFARAVEQAERLIDNLARNDRLMLIVAGPAGQGARTAFLSDKAELRSALRSARAYDAPAATDEALRLAVSSLAAQGRGELRGTIYLLSDGVGVTLPNLPGLNEALRYVRIGQTGRNAGITSLSVEPGEQGRQEVAVGVKNFSPAGAMDVTVSFYYGRPDNWVDAQQLRLEAGQSATAVLRKALPPGRLWVKLTTAGGDGLALDDVGYALLPESRRLRVVLVSPGNRVLRDFLRVADAEGMLSGAEVSPAAYVGDEPADVTIFDGVAPPKLPEGDVLLIEPPGAVAGFERVGEADWPAVTNVRTEADVLRFVNLADFAVARTGVYGRDSSAVTLIDSDRTPLLAYTQQGADRRYLLAFHLADSSWATEAGLLIFLGNVLERARMAHYVGMAQLLATGGSARLGGGDQPAEVTVPDGARHDVPAGVDSFAGTFQAGFYRVRRGGREREFAANLLSPQQSDILPRSLAVAGGQDVATQRDVVRSNRPVWPVLAIAALALLLVEWYCYHRRVS